MVLCIVRLRCARGQPLRRRELSKSVFAPGEEWSLIQLTRRQKLPYDINAP
jgi:hypothetical protein